jgi:hypothetical protein
MRVYEKALWVIRGFESLPHRQSILPQIDHQPPGSEPATLPEDAPNRQDVGWKDEVGGVTLSAAEPRSQ